MFHLFSKTYMDFDFNLEQGNRIIISEEFNKFVFDVDTDYKGYIADTYDNLVKHYFNNDEQHFWNFLTALPHDQSFMIYCDETAYVVMLVKYFKGLFPNLLPRDLYILYRLTMMKFKLMHSQITHEWDTAKRRMQDMEILSFTPFNNLTKKIKGPKQFDLSVKQRIGMEYLIAAHLSEVDSNLETEFQERAHKILWKSIVWEINEFKRNILNGFYNLDTLYPQLKDTIQYESTTLDDVIAVVPELSFLKDIDCNPHNLEYVKSTYNVVDIFKAYYKLMKHTHGDAESIDGFLRAHAHYAGTPDSVFNATDEMVVVEKDIDALMEIDINTKFGTSVFARTEYRKKMNPHLISYFYHLKRTGDFKTLNRFVAA